ncbi:Nucleotidyltransferase [Coniophora puteana RWD-64-598 SS2]|uniref:DNA polymerase n=1 Tax=Coniophora puteana (strain RWD-64-598) TaxID=741705 RepID=A0A5M3MMY3_CONPW|nr:Nucleotidyltransferase [Coniophora puteana RWD-64-598 SS2]EIW80380.1 Nucleotidyltransferase [Coniophora puteana RWD-64-598 SS2]
MPKRPVRSSSDSGSSRERTPKRVRSSSPWRIDESPSHDEETLKIHVLRAKMDDDAYASLVKLIETSRIVLRRHRNTDAEDAEWKNLVFAEDIKDADVIVTAIRMRQRLERHISWQVAEPAPFNSSTRSLIWQKTKAVVTPQWLEETVRQGTPAPCGEHAALNDLHDDTVRQCPDGPNLLVESGSTTSRLSADIPPSSADPAGEPPTSTELEHLSLSHKARLCLFRASPLICPNQALIDELKIIQLSRKLEGEERSMLSYQRAIAMIKSYPHIITLERLDNEVEDLPYLGTKLVAMIEEYVTLGKISEAESIRESSRFQALSAFSRIYGIGPHTGRRLYDLGLRTLEELDRYYEVTPGSTDGSALSSLELYSKANEETVLEETIKVALALRHDLCQTISRHEAERIGQILDSELAHVEQGCRTLLVGGYRRGKVQGNDVDILITHPNWTLGSQKSRNMSKRLVQSLRERGILVHVMHLAGFHGHNVLRTHHWDSLEKALTILRVPSAGDAVNAPVHRQVDLIFAAPEVFWTAVVGWTGSTMFERDLRLWAKERGMKFDSSGISRRHDSKLFFPRTEREVFDLLELPYIHPALRNADA